ncbi:MAG: pyruvate dehydrogenase complex dihydrolipoamide acetyltransferase [Rickettsiales bacterium]|nr:pyruvate dehydrogenase complex dihydrolipoamide acetyltransferase [Rickettsiales bacterium]
MPIEITMPALSPTMTEGNLAKWIKKEGDKVEAGDVIAEIETDKATMEVEAVDEGTLGKILVSEGSENVGVNSVIALLLEDGEDKSALKDYKSTSTPKETTAEKTDKTENSSDKKNTQEAKTKEIPATPTAPMTTKSGSTGSFNNKIKASPLAKRIAKEENVSLYQVTGSGPHGRIIKDDIIDFLRNPGSASGVVRRNPQEHYAVKNSNIRKVIARRLLESKQNTPHFYLSCEFNIDRLLEIRATINSVAPVDENKKPAYKISVNDLIIKACALSLKEVPLANSSWSEEEIIVYNNIDISMAVAIDGGLITPIVKNADQKDLKTISVETKELAKKARENKLQPEEFQGGSFSISNLGMFGIDNFSAIVNPPQSCILAVSRAVKKPVVGDNDQITISNLMNVTLSSDHRSVDGAVGAEFLKSLRKYIEQPVLMLL